MEAAVDVKDYYYILGISRSATLEDIKRAFRDKAKQYHPDVCSRSDAHERFIEVGEAYEILKDPNTRKEYDLYIDRMNRSREQRQTSASSNSYNKGTNNSDFRDYQQRAKAQAERYADMDLEKLITNVLGFAYEVGRALILGERDKPDITVGDYIKLGFSGLLLTICIIISLTGIGAIPGIVIARGAFEGTKKNGKFIGIGPLLISTLVADFIAVVGLLSLLHSLFN